MLKKILQAFFFLLSLRIYFLREKEEISMNGNGICPSKKRKDDLSLPTWCLKQINSGILEQVYQWVAYYAARLDEPFLNKVLLLDFEICFV